jgi:hypothetical protein
MRNYIDEVEIFEAEDGTRFYCAFDCKKYEEEIDFEEKRINFLNQEINKLFEQHGLVFEVYSLNNDSNNCTIYLKDDEGELEECDENLWISMEDFDALQYEIHYKYGFLINESIYYWSK